MGEPVLALKAVVEPSRPSVDIYGGRFDLAIPSDFGLRESAKMGAQSRQMDKLLSKDELTEKDLDKLIELQDAMVRRVVRKLPEDVFKQLPDEHKLALIGAFNTEAAKWRADLLEAAGKPEASEQ